MPGTTISAYAKEPDRGLPVAIDGARDDMRAAAGRAIGDVAFTWGFVDAAHFGRVFKRR